MTSKSLEPCVICGEPIGDNTIVLPARMIPHGYTTEEIIVEPNDGMPFQGFPR